jgi:hypothetical protein
LNSDKHKRADAAEASAAPLTSFFRKENFGDTELKLAAAEGCWAYHTVTHNQTFRSTDCTSKLIQRCFDNKYACARTKTEAIICNVLAPYSAEQVEKDLTAANFVSIYTDASNHKSIKLFPVLVRYFKPDSGIHVKILEMKELPAETSETVSKYLLETVDEHKLKDKLIALCADNTNSNFGGAARKGRKNVYRKLEQSVGRSLIGIGCAAHIVHNAVQTATDCLPIDIEAAVVKIYSYFYLYTVRVESLKEFCQFVDTEYQQLLGYSRTRWLALVPAVGRLIDMFVPLKSYFESQEKCPTVIQQFFLNPLAQVWLHFAHSQAETFHSTVIQMEGQKVTAVQVYKALNDLKSRLTARKENIFMPQKVRDSLKLLEDEGLVDMSAFKRSVAEYYSASAAYLDQWCAHFGDMKFFEWTSLDSSPTWADVQTCYDWFVKSVKTVSSSAVDDSQLFDEVVNVRSFVSEERLEKWNSENTSADLRWVQLLKHFTDHRIPCANVTKLVEFCLSLPGTNAPTERVFSQINDIWTSEKTQLQVETLKCMMVVKTNITLDCVELYNQLLTEVRVLKAIHSSEKYKFRKPASEASVKP